MLPPKLTESIPCDYNTNMLDNRDIDSGEFGFECGEKSRIRLDKRKDEGCHRLFVHNIEYSYIKHLPSLFFLISIVMLGVIMLRFIPNTYSFMPTSTLYKEKARMKYIPEYFSDQSSTVKATIVVSQLLLFFTIVCLTGLIQQRISVPELKDETSRNLLILFTCCFSVICMILMVYFNKDILALSRKIGLVDNLVFFLYMLSSFLYSLMTHNLLERLDVNELLINGYVLLYKKILLFLMGLQVFTYFISNILVSFYNPIIPQEKVLLSILMVCFSVNSVLFILCLMLFIHSLKYDFNFVSTNLMMRPDEEYFTVLNYSH